MCASNEDIWLLPLSSSASNYLRLFWTTSGQLLGAQATVGRLPPPPPLLLRPPMAHQHQQQQPTGSTLSDPSLMMTRLVVDVSGELLSLRRTPY
jgi:hypothetical protein